MIDAIKLIKLCSISRSFIGGVKQLSSGLVLAHRMPCTNLQSYLWHNVVYIRGYEERFANVSVSHN